MTIIIAEPIKTQKGRIYLPSLNQCACCLAWLLFGFAVGLSSCKQPKTEEASKPKAEEIRPKAKAGEAELIAIANKYALEKGEDLSVYKNPEVTEHGTYWDVSYDNKDGIINPLLGDLSVIIDRQTLQPRPNDCYKLQTGDPRILEIVNNFMTHATKDLSLYDPPRITEFEKVWSVMYRCKMYNFSCELNVTVSRTSCKPRFSL